MVSLLLPYIYLAGTAFMDVHAKLKLLFHLVIQVRSYRIFGNDGRDLHVYRWISIKVPVFVLQMELEWACSSL